MANLDFRLKKIDETRNYFKEGIKDDLICKALNYFEHFVFIFAVSGCVLISVFVSLIGVPVGITNSALGWKTCAITVGIKKHKAIIKTKRKSHDKIVLLAKTKLSSSKVWFLKF